MGVTDGKSGCIERREKKMETAIWGLGLLFDIVLGVW